MMNNDYTYAAQYLGLRLRRDIKYRQFFEFKYIFNTTSPKEARNDYDDIIDMFECTCEIDE